MHCIPEKRLVFLVKRSFAPLIDWEPKPPKPFFPTPHFSQEEQLIGARIRSHDTVRGNCVQRLVAKISSENERWETHYTEKPNGNITDIMLIDKELDIHFFMFVQSQVQTKNDDGSKSIKRKMSKAVNSRGVVAIAYGDPFREVDGKVYRLVGSELYSFLTSTNANYDNGDASLYNRVMTQICALKAREFE